MKLVETNEYGTKEWTLHVWRQQQSENRFDKRRGTVCALHVGECVKAEDDDRAQCVFEKRAVNAFMSHGEVAMPLQSAFTICNPKDSFSRSLGRKLAFTRAIQSMPQPQRKRLWEAYFKVVKVA